MNQRAEYLIRIFEKIGTPLMLSILDAARGQPDNDNLEEHAQKMAELLAKTVQASVDLGQAIDINKTGDSSDSVRLALAGLVGPVIGQSYKNTRQIPDENALKKITQALQSILSFSGNFTPSDEHNARLKMLEAGGQAVDTPQTAIQQIQAFTPVLQAVSTFSFGQPEQKLIIDVTNRLSAKAKEIRTSSFGTLTEDEQKRVDLALMKSLAELYQSCHQEEVARISAGDEAQAGGVTLDPLWEKFDKRAVLVQVLAQNLMPDAAQSGAAAGGPAGPAVAATPPPAAEAPPAAPPAPPPQAEQPPATPPPTAPETPTPPPQSPAENAAPATANPMSMFAKKPEESATETPPAAPPPQAEQPPAAPPAPPPQAETPPAASEVPPPQNPETPAAPTENEASKGNPMAFFKPKDEGEA